MKINDCKLTSKNMITYVNKNGNVWLYNIYTQEIYQVNIVKKIKRKYTDCKISKSMLLENYGKNV